MSETESRPTVLLVVSSAHSMRLPGKQLQEYFHTVSAEDAEDAGRAHQNHRSACQYDMTPRR